MRQSARLIEYPKVTDSPPSVAVESDPDTEAI